jgi:5-(carboxyamino)imidazole ribonucleotide synthase
LGVGIRVLAQTSGDSAAQVVRDVVLGDHDDPIAVQAFAHGCDVVTFDHEHVPTALLESLEADGVAVRPGPAALVHAQDKLVMRERLSAAGVPCPAWAEAVDADAVGRFGDQHGWPVVLKTARGGYDGKGVHMVPDVTAAAAVMNGAPEGLRWLVEEKVAFVRELSAMVARSPHGQAAAWPVVETVQVDGICREVIAPARISQEHAVAAQEAALQVAGALGVVGVMAVELFQTADGVVVNELAMRPHNSGHWSIDGSVTSQFEQHLRAVLDLPLGATTMTAPAAVMVNVLGGDHPDLYHAYLHTMARDPGLKVHMYGKAVKPGRKIGHVTVIGDDIDDLLERGRHAAAYITGEITE